MNNQLLVGLVLIGMGILLAVLAYMFLTSREPSKEPGEAPVSRDRAPDEDVDEIAAGFESPETMDDAATAAPDDEAGIDEPPPPSLEPEPQSAAQKTPAPEPGPRSRIPIATLLRDEVSGKLIVQIGDKAYEDREALEESPHGTKLEYAAKELSRWLAVEEAPARPRVEQDSEPQDPKPESMIEQINLILQERIETSGRTDLAVRLTEGPGGTARVLIGVNSYELSDVPDPEIRTLIREAVAQWEATK